MKCILELTHGNNTGKKRSYVAKIGLLAPQLNRAGGLAVSVLTIVAIGACAEESCEDGHCIDGVSVAVKKHRAQLATNGIEQVTL